MLIFDKDKVYSKAFYKAKTMEDKAIVLDKYARGKLLYLSGHSRPDIACSVGQAVKFTFAPKHSHEEALKKIGCYLLAMQDKGLLLSPTENLDIHAYPDADFVGLYSYEDSLDPVYVRIQMGHVINVAGCPVL